MTLILRPARSDRFIFWPANPSFPNLLEWSWPVFKLTSSSYCHGFNLIIYNDVAYVPINESHIQSSFACTSWLSVVIHWKYNIIIQKPTNNIFHNITEMHNFSAPFHNSSHHVTCTLKSLIELTSLPVWKHNFTHLCWPMFIKGSLLPQVKGHAHKCH